MAHGDWLTTGDITAIFGEEIAAAGGRVSDTVDDGHRLFLRSVLPRIREVRTRDRVQGGVALRATEQDVWIHPYVFRQVCTNGAILAHAVETRHVEAIDFLSPDDAAWEVRCAIRACAADEPFQDAAVQMRSAQEVAVDALLNVMPMLKRLSARDGSQLVDAVLSQFFQGGDRSRFGLMNAITAAARDTRDPELRWRLEELGGGIPAGLDPTGTLEDTADDELLVG